VAGLGAQESLELSIVYSQGSPSMSFAEKHSKVVTAGNYKKKDKENPLLKLKIYRIIMK
jgi:hypothetical protein